VDLFRSQNRKGETDYAYALYNLGTALMDSGKPADAIPYLQERLQVSSDRRPLVQSKIDQAKAAAGQTPSGGKKAKKG
jgi:serine/threonine-protein kinase